MRRSEAFVVSPTPTVTLACLGNEGTIFKTCRSCDNWDDPVVGVSYCKVRPESPSQTKFFIVNSWRKRLPVQRVAPLHLTPLTEELHEESTFSASLFLNCLGNDIVANLSQNLDDTVQEQPYPTPRRLWPDNGEACLELSTRKAPGSYSANVRCKLLDAIIKVLTWLCCPWNQCRELSYRSSFYPVCAYAVAG